MENSLINYLNSTYEFENGIYYNSMTGIKNHQKIVGKTIDVNNNIKIGNKLIHSCSRVGLRMLDIKPTDIGVVYGSGRGNLLTYVARNCKLVLGQEYNLHKLLSGQASLKLKRINNVLFLNTDLDEKVLFNNVFDFVIINGTSKSYYNGKNDRISKIFHNVFKSLKKNGKLYFASNNKINYRKYICNRLSYKNREYLQSKYGYHKKLRKAGFKSIKSYAVFPDYKYPMKILPMNNYDDCDYEPVYNNVGKMNIMERIKRKIYSQIDKILFNRLKLFDLSPSFIFIAK